MRRTLTLLVLTISLLCSCSSLDNAMFSLALKFYPCKQHSLEMKDGYNSTYYTFHFGDKDKTDTYLFVIPGSGYATTQVNHYLLNKYPGNAKVFALQKRYIEHNAKPGDTAPQEFHDRNFHSQWINDQFEFISHILADKHDSIKNVVVLGLSEGGSVAPVMASWIPQITHLAVLGYGGMNGLEEFRLIGKQHDQDFDKLYEMVREDTSTNKFYGDWTPRYWKEIMEFSPMDYLKLVECPIFYALGAKDQSIPMQSFMYLQMAFKELGKSNLTTRIYPNCYHMLDDENDDSHMQDFLVDLYQWINPIHN